MNATWHQLSQAACSRPVGVQIPTAGPQPSRDPPGPTAAVSRAQSTLRQAFRQTWEEHVLLPAVSRQLESSAAESASKALAVDQ